MLLPGNLPDYCQKLITEMPTTEQILKTEAKNLGFLLSGITTPERPPHFEHFKQWINQGHHADMQYLTRPDTLLKRENPALLMENVQSILVLEHPYQPTQRLNASARQQHPTVAAYAAGPDYHDLLLQKIEVLMENFHQTTGLDFKWKAFTDSAPILEHDLAVRAGLGWIGKNSLLLNRNLGSYFLLAEIFLSIRLQSDQPETNQYCGSCTKCIDACPTHAILNNHTLDANRCLSYLTIENKGAIPEEFRQQLQESIFGCDICQQVCPWNQKLFVNQIPEQLFEPEESQLKIPIENELLLSPQEFNQKYKTSPIKRSKRRGYLRNLCLWAGNSGNTGLIPILQTLNNAEEDSIIREHCQWAIQRLEALTEHNPNSHL